MDHLLLFVAKGGKPRAESDDSVVEQKVACDYESGDQEPGKVELSVENIQVDSKINFGKEIARVNVVVGSEHPGAEDSTDYQKDRNQDKSERLQILI